MHYVITETKTYRFTDVSMDAAKKLFKECVDDLNYDVEYDIVEEETGDEETL